MYKLLKTFDENCFNNGVYTVPEEITDVDMSNNSICLNNDQTIKCYIGPKYKNQFMEVFNHGNFSNNLDSINNTK